MDNDPFAYDGHVLYDDTLSGRNVCTTSSLGQRVSSGVSHEITPREVTARGSSPIRNTCNDMVDDRTHTIHFGFDSRICLLIAPVPVNWQVAHDD